ncbi:MAG: DUF262 domain-containing protein [Pseudomonadota bacterium]
MPRFQRDFVWTLDKSAALIDSVLKGFPIGALIFWRTSETLRDHRQLGRFKLPEPVAGAERNYVLDGQQRLTSLYAALRGIAVTLSDGRTRDFSEIWVDLSVDDIEKDFCITALADRDETRCIPLVDLFEKSGLSLSKDYPEDTHEMIEAHRDAIAAYLIPYVQLQNAPISVATEVFTRVNIGGEKLSLFEIMVAKTYDADRDFDLLTEWEKLRDRLVDVKYTSVQPINILHLIGMILDGDVRRQRILDIERAAFIDTWPKAVKALEAAVDFCRKTVGLQVSHLLPYTACLAPLGLYFAQKGVGKLSKADATELTRYVFSCGLASRYTGPINTNLNQDRVAILKLVETGVLSLDFEPPEMDPKWLARQEFRANEAFSKTFLAIMARKGPKSLGNNSSVDLDNSAMQRANSRNFHHFFPKAFLRKRGIQAEGHSENAIANITLVDGGLNNLIRARAPSEYLATFEEENDKLSAALASHHISARDSAPVWRDDYEEFLIERSRAMLRDLDKVL